MLGFLQTDQLLKTDTRFLVILLVLVLTYGNGEYLQIQVLGGPLDH